MRYNFDIAFNHPDWRECVSLEYVLTHGYSQDLKADTARYMELSSRIRTAATTTE